MSEAQMRYQPMRAWGQVPSGRLRRLVGAEPAGMGLAKVLPRPHWFGGLDLKLWDQS